jgi:steroid delta-isomerase-like uncharacterized protein
MRTRRSIALLVSLFVLSIVLAPSTALAQTSEGLAEAKMGVSAGSLEVFLAFIVDHDPAYYAEDATFQIMADPEPLEGREAIAGLFGALYGGSFTDTHVEIRSVIADGPRVVLEFVYNGTNTGEFMGLPATGERVSVPIMGIYEIEGDSITHGRIYFDMGTMMRQLGHAE